MKRTPLKRSPMPPRKAPMNRTGIKRASRQCPKIGLRPKRARSLVSKPKPLSKINKAYREAYPDCEISKLLASNGIRLPQGRSQVHHIQWGHSQRSDVWANLITLSKPAHDWCHEHPAEGRIVCLYAKLRKHELKWEVLDELYTGNALTKRSYRDYVSTLKPQFSWCESLRLALCKGGGG